jgi:ankyrin repeat protein
MEQPTLLHDVRNDKGRTPFHDACFHSYRWLVEELYPFADTNMIDYGGENALHHIIQGFINDPSKHESCIATIRYLLKRNPFLVMGKNNSGETAYDYACKWEEIKRGRQTVTMNGKNRKYKSMRIDNKFWSDIVITLIKYHIHARFCMFKYFMEKDTNDNSHVDNST